MQRLFVLGVAGAGRNVSLSSMSASLVVWFTDGGFC
jgi:hypothetical protein